jgi:2-amino-4-hydroxy-6-hydroxymethyldihydropteridine diphosphokinase
MTEAYVAIGSNVGDRLANLAAATRAISEAEGLVVLAASHVYESEPWGVTDQPAFANAVLRVEFAGEADALLELCQGVETRLGRTAGEARYGPRVIDLDILLFGDEEWVSPALRIPHPRMLERDFVVTPLLEVAPAATMPDGSPVTGTFAFQGRIIGILGTLSGFEDLTPADVVGADDAEGVALPPDAPLSREDAIGDWVPIGPKHFEPAMSGGGTDLSLLLFEATLLQAGVPCAFYPYRPYEGPALPFASRATVRLMVPAARIDEASEIIDALGDLGG